MTRWAVHHQILLPIESMPWAAALEAFNSTEHNIRCLLYDGLVERSLACCRRPFAAMRAAAGGRAVFHLHHLRLRPPSRASPAPATAVLPHCAPASRTYYRRRLPKGLLSYPLPPILARRLFDEMPVTVPVHCGLGGGSHGLTGTPLAVCFLGRVAVCTTNVSSRSVSVGSCVLFVCDYLTSFHLVFDPMKLRKWLHLCCSSS